MTHPAVPSLLQECNDCFHGTTQQRAESIAARGFELPALGDADANRFGRAIYFWKGSKACASWWARRVASKTPTVTTIAVLRSTVRLGKFLDLLTWEGQKFVKKVATELSKRAPSKDYTHTDASVLTFMAQKGWIETVQLLDLGPLNASSGGVRELFPGSYLFEGPRVIICVYVLENILETSIVLREEVKFK